MNPPQSHFTSADEVEAAFYAAFNRCDREAMADLWADDEVVCIHPGSQAIVGYEAVIRSWSHIFTHAELPDIQVNIVKRAVTEALVVHVGEERISTGKATATVLATNVYKKYEEGWLMVEHHGSVMQVPTQEHVLQ